MSRAVWIDQCAAAGGSRGVAAVLFRCFFVDLLEEFSSNFLDFHLLNWRNPIKDLTMAADKGETGSAQVWNFASAEATALNSDFGEVSRYLRICWNLCSAVILKNGFLTGAYYWCHWVFLYCCAKKSVFFGLRSLNVIKVFSFRILLSCLTPRQNYCVAASLQPPATDSG